MSVEVLDTARGMINQLWSNQEPIPDCPDYLFDILCNNKKRKDERAYREYQSALRNFNNSLKDLARISGFFLYTAPFLGNDSEVSWSAN